MSALVIGPTQRALIAELRTVAAANPFDVRRSQAAADKDIAAYRDMMRTLTLELPVGYAVTYTHEIHPKVPPPGLCHHISISVDRPHVLPSPEAVEMILAEFGMQPLKASLGVWIEDIKPGDAAVNVLQPMQL